ncbi:MULTISPECIES: hypothetical protein [unclassified Streptomyces]|uniref:hypothetical protein n=1 Tax=unclassified Streptomyces TaxID=2593676 RepID=UPI00331E0D92
MDDVGAQVGAETGADFTGFVTDFPIDGVTGGSRIPAGTTLTPGTSLTSRSAKLTLQAEAAVRRLQRRRTR